VSPQVERSSLHGALVEVGGRTKDDLRLAGIRDRKCPLMSARLVVVVRPGAYVPSSLQTLGAEVAHRDRPWP
jgi:hypothetical protein